jgi:hypothetical protein
MIRRTSPTIGLLLAFVAVAARSSPGYEPSAARPRIVENGEPRYVIHHGADAPASVRRAAAELQRVVEIMTGAKLPVSTEPAERMISLGENAESRRAGVTLGSAPGLDTYLVRTVGPSLFIVGNDSAEEPLAGWATRGTLYGTYDLLEMFGVSWLLPGPWGEDVPRRRSLDLPALDVKRGPAFFARVLQDVQDRSAPANDRTTKQAPNKPQSGMPLPNEPKIWLERQKLPSIHDGFKLQAGHSWDDFISPEQAAEHPEWLAKDAAGKPRQFPRHKSIKFCTREPELIEAFVAGVNRRLQANPTMQCASISASDGGDFCQCPKCAPSIETDPHGKPSYSALMVEFYDAVARRVAKSHPDRLVCGLVYYNYQYPPRAVRGDAWPAEPLAGNLWLTWAPLNYYGWGLAKPVYRDEFREVAAGWRRTTPNVAYHNYSTWMRSYNGAPIPPSLRILKQELPGAYEAGFRGVNMVGLGAWGYGGPTNYILAKQMWDPKIDVDATYQEWLERAYGPGWQSMRSLYEMLAERITARKEKESPVYRGQNYEANHDFLTDVHAPVFAKMERLYRAAMAQAETEPQRKRLAMFGENLIRLHHDLREAGLLTGDAADESTFYRNEAEYQKFLAETEPSYAQYRDHRSRYLVPVWKGEYRGE